MKAARSQAKRLSFVKKICCIILGILIAISIEVIVFNIRSVTTMGLKEVNLSNPGTQFDSSAQANTFIFQDLNADIQSIYIATSGDNCEIQVYGTDAGNSNYYKLGSMVVSQSSPESHYSVIHTSGLVKSLKIELDGSGTQIDHVSYNSPIPFSISKTRILIFAAIIFFLYALRPSSLLFKRRYVPNKTTSVIMWAALSCVAIILITGVTIPYYSSTQAEGISLGDLSQNHQYYDLAKAFSDGHVYLNSEVSPELLAMDNPYDTGERIANNVPFFWDRAYYEGKYYVYFGILPCLIYHLPFYILTGQEFPNEIGVLISLLLFYAGAIKLLNQVCLRWFPGASIGDFLIGLLIILIGSWSVYLLRFADIYALPIATGLACLTWGLALWIESTRTTKIQVLPAVLGSFCVGLVVACRPQLFVISFVGLILFVKSLTAKENRRSGVLVVFIPIVIVFVLIGIYNVVRFGSPLDFGANYNLTTNDMTQRTFSINLVSQALFSYFIQLPVLSINYPFVQSVVPNVNYLGTFISQSMPGGILSTTPFFILSFFLFFVHKETKELNLLKILAGVLVFLSICLAILDAEGAGILARYFCDFGIFLSIATVFTYFILAPPFFEKTLEDCHQKSNKTTTLVSIYRTTFSLALSYAFLIQIGWLFS